jgi:hypothetical protein
MKNFYALSAGCCLLGTSQPSWTYEPRGARSCAGWQEFRQDEKSGNFRNAEIYETWMVGYLSGIVAGSGTDFLVGTDNESVFLMADNFCSANLQMNLAASGTATARQLMLMKGIVHMPTLP